MEEAIVRIRLLEPGRAQHAPAGLIGALALVLAVEAWLGRSPAMPESRSRLDASWQTAMERASGPEAGAEILAFGDSLIKLGILPRVLEARLGCTAYNLAVLGGGPPTSHALLRRVLDAGHRPRLIVVSFSPLLLGMDPRTNLNWWCRLLDARERFELAWRSRDPRFAAPLLVEGALASRGYAEVFRDLVGLSAFTTPHEGERMEPDELRTLLRNWQINRGAQVAPRQFVPIAGALPRPFHGPQWSWQPHPAHADHVERFLDLAQQRGIPVYWVLTPADALWLERNTRAGTVSSYRRFVEGQAARFANLTVLDGQRTTWDRALFRDPIHLNRDGAVRLSLAVADSIGRDRGRDQRQDTSAPIAQRWITLDEAAGPATASRGYQKLLEDLDQSRLAVNRAEHDPITMEGPRS